MKALLFIVGFASFVTITASAQRKHSSANQRKTMVKTSATMLAMLQGRWSSLEDKKTFFQIEGDKQIDIYGRDILDTATINFYDECPRRTSAEDEKRTGGKYLVVQIRADDFYCYSIDKISTQQLVLTYLPKGTILRYRKVASKKLEPIQTDVED